MKTKIKPYSLVVKISLITSGKIVLTGTTDDIKDSILGTVYKIEVNKIPASIDSINALCGQVKVNYEEKNILVKIKDEKFINDVLQFFINQEISIQYVSKLKLEDHLIEFFK